jgi:hypothetical protein
MERLLRRLAFVRGLVLVAAVFPATLAGCGGARAPVSRTGSAADETPPVASAPESRPGARLFFDDFSAGAPDWEDMFGDWEVSEAAISGAVPKTFALTFAGAAFWRNYQVRARVTIANDRHGFVGLTGRGQDDHHYIELVLGRDQKGKKSWAIRQREDHTWKTLAEGPFDYQLGVPYDLALVMRGDRAEARLYQGGAFVRLGETDTVSDLLRSGRLGLVTYGGIASFDDVSAERDPDSIVALVDASNPYTVLTQHEQGSSQTTPTRGYTNLFLLPNPCPRPARATRRATSRSPADLARSSSTRPNPGRAAICAFTRGPTRSAPTQAAAKKARVQAALSSPMAA